MKSKKIGTRDCYFVYDVKPEPDGKFHVWEGGSWGCAHKGAFKTAKAAQNWALKQNNGNDSYND